MSDNVIDSLASPSPSQTPAPTGGGNVIDSLGATPAPSPQPGPQSNSDYYGNGATQQKQRSNHSFLQELFGVAGVWQEVGNAMTEGRLSGKGEFSKVPEVFKTDPATAMDRFGLNSQEFLQYVVQHSSPNDYEHKWAAYNLSHPGETGWETFGENFLPGMNVGGGPMGKLGGYLHGWLSASEKGRAFLSLTSPFRNIAKVAGDTGKHALQAMVNTVRHVDELAMDSTRSIFGGLTHQEQIDVIRRMQNGRTVPRNVGQTQLGSGQARITGSATSAVPEGESVGDVFVPGQGKVTSKHDLDHRAFLLNQTLRSTTKRKVESGLLPISGVHNEQSFFPMKGAYRDPRLNEDEFDFIEQLRTGKAGGTYTVPQNYHKTFTNIDEALESGYLRDDFSPAQQLYRHTSRGNQNFAANEAIGQLPSTLIRHPDREMFNNNPLGARAVPDIRVTRGGPAFQPESAASSRMLPPPKAELPGAPGSALAEKSKLPANPDEDIYQAFYRQHPEYSAKPEQPPPGWVSVDHVFPGARLLPELRGTWLKTEFAEWLRDHGGSSLTGQPIKLFGSRGLADWVERYNSGMRQAIIANPAYHLLWNIAWNGASALGSSPLHLIESTGRAVLGTMRAISPQFDNLVAKFGETKVAKMFMQASNDYANDVYDAIKAGATAEFGASHAALGGRAAELFTRPWGDNLTFTQKMDKLFTQMSDWNKRAVFGPHGEQAMANRLFQTFKKRGYDQGTAAEMTREALGNYQNVDPNNQLAQLFFFYPWLKSNSAYWAKKFLTNPTYGAAPLEGTRRNNQIAGDPNFSGQFPTQDYTIYTGTKNGQAGYWTLPLPQRMAGGMINAAATGSPDEMSFELGNVLSSHANPVVATAANWWATVQAQKHGGVDPAVGSNYNIMWDKDAPRDEQIKEIGSYAATHFLPIPLVQYAVQDALRTGMDPKKFAGYMAQSAGGGYFHNRPNLQQSRQINKFRSQFERVVHQQERALNAGSITKKQRDARIARAYAAYKSHRDEILNGQQAQQATPQF